MRTYSTFRGFAAHLERLALMGAEMTEIIAEAAAIKIRDDAKAKLGIYQAAAGPFEAWAPLSPIGVKSWSDFKPTTGFSNAGSFYNRRC